jgi:hypothetical protein
MFLLLHLLYTAKVLHKRVFWFVIQMVKIFVVFSVALDRESAFQFSSVITGEPHNVQFFICEERLI